MSKKLDQRGGRENPRRMWKSTKYISKRLAEKLFQFQCEKYMKMGNIEVPRYVKSRKCSLILTEGFNDKFHDR